MSTLKTVTGIALVIVLMAGCATQRYGRETPVSETERALLDCDAIDLEIAQSQAFLENVRQQRADTTGAHVLGALGDFGIGNVLEGNAAEESARVRLDQLVALRAERNCDAAIVQEPDSIS